MTLLEQMLVLRAAARRKYGTDAKLRLYYPKAFVEELRELRCEEVLHNLGIPTHRVDGFPFSFADCIERNGPLEVVRIKQ